MSQPVTLACIAALLIILVLRPNLDPTIIVTTIIAILLPSPLNPKPPEGPTAKTN